MQENDSDELRRVIQELEFRTTVTSAMLETLDLEQILYGILCGITSGDGLGFNRAFLFLADEAGRSLRVTMAVGPSSQGEAVKIWDEINRVKLTLPDLLHRYAIYRAENAPQQLTQKMGGFHLPLQDLEAMATSRNVLFIARESPLAGAMARCLSSRSPFASNGLTLTHSIGGGEIMEFRNLAIVPLYVSERLIGAILADNLYNGNSVGSEDLRRLHGLCNLAALAIDRARLHAQTVAMAEVDGLTGVYNRRYYQQELDGFLERSRRSGQVLSIVVFDLDFFKSYNDQHGHLVGDQVLKDVAKLIKENVRQRDMVARYGGEEFVVLFADTPAEAAIQIAEKLRQVVKKASLADGKVQGLTLSAGVASTSGFESAEELFARADRALYQAKSLGRDKIVLGN